VNEAPAAAPAAPGYNFVDAARAYWETKGAGAPFAKGAMCGRAAPGTEQSIKEFFIKFNQLLVSMFKEAHEKSRQDHTKSRLFFEQYKIATELLCKLAEDKELVFDQVELSALLYGFMASYATTHSVK